jgi:hypothetical protein
MNAYARAMNPSGTPHVNDRLEAKAQSVLSVATSPEAYEKQVRRLWIKVQASKKAIGEARKGVGQPEPFPGDRSEGQIVKQNGHLYQQQPDGSWKGLQ